MRFSLLLSAALLPLAANAQAQDAEAHAGGAGRPKCEHVIPRNSEASHGAACLACNPSTSLLVLPRKLCRPVLVDVAAQRPLTPWLQRKAKHIARGVAIAKRDRKGPHATNRRAPVRPLANTARRSPERAHQRSIPVGRIALCEARLVLTSRSPHHLTR